MIGKIFIGVAAGFLLLSTLGFSQSLTVGKKAPDINLEQMLQGHANEVVTLNDLKGKRGCSRFLDYLVLAMRYGMTEIGMAISNPYYGKRKAGRIGQPLPNVKIRLVDEKNDEVQLGEQGEIQVKGPTVFKEYWQNPEATKESFSDDGWFKTGDIAIYDGSSYKILGRNSVDIIKSGGYKISALEIEEVLRTYPAIKDCGVVGIPDDEWGEIIGASLILAESPLDQEHLEDWIRDRLPGYKIPRKYVVLEDLPRNAMGKVTKNELIKLF